MGTLGCGGESDSTGGGTLGADAWRERAVGFCSDALQEATALPLPQSRRELAADASARAEIVATLRDGLVGLGQPTDVSADDLGAYVDDLDADVDALSDLARAAKSGAGAEGSTPIDESSGQLANRLELPECAALSNAIARTP